MREVAAPPRLSVYFLQLPSPHQNTPIVSYSMTEEEELLAKIGQLAGKFHF